MDYKVIDLIRALYVACDGNLEMPVEGVCLSGGELIESGHKPTSFANGQLRRGTLFGYMNVAIHKTARENGKATVMNRQLQSNEGVYPMSICIPTNLIKQ